MKPRRDRRREAEPAVNWPQRLQLLILGTAVALIVIGTLIHSEATVREGSYAPLAAVWCILLAVWALGLCLSPRPRVTFGWTEIAVLAFVAWHSLAGVIALRAGQGRQALNVVWLVASYGCAVFLLRQTLRSASEVRALFAAMIWLAALQALVGVNQYLVTFPAQRRAYAADPEQFLQDNGYVGQAAEEGSPQRMAFENRLNSKEPLGTFSLANSLAGLLAPWLIAVLAAGHSALGEAQQRRTLIAAALCATLIAGCLVLTKSRTGYLAAGCGLALLAMYGRDRGWRLDWRIPATLATALVVLALAAVYFGGLDAEVLSEAPKSLLYRLEYWRATAALIADHPLFGCGPGNFQENYTAYKLPQASENVADPHNFLLEIWSTAGTPALLLALLLAAAFAVDLRNESRRTVARPDEADPQIARWTILGGALAGLVAALPIGYVVNFPLTTVGRLLPWLPEVWLFGLPLWGAAWWAFGPWIARGRISLAATVIPILVLLVNLLAAGAVVFPGVMATLLVLSPAALCLAGSVHPLTTLPESSALPREWPHSKRAALWLALAAVLLTILCQWSEYWPVLVSQRALAEAEDARIGGRWDEAEPLALRAAAADRYAPQPWITLGVMRLNRWLESGLAADFAAFEQAAEALKARDPKSHQTYYRRGGWYLTAWRKSQDPKYLEQALAEYRRASECYPNQALYHAQLGWVLDLAGRPAEAKAEAEIAQRLDNLTPHLDRKLKGQHIADPQIVEGRVVDATQPAEQIVEQLRTSGGAGKGAMP